MTRPNSTRKRVAAESDDTSDTTWSDSDAKPIKSVAKKQKKVDDARKRKPKRPTAENADENSTNGVTKPKIRRIDKAKGWSKKLEVEAILSHRSSTNARKSRKYRVKLKDDPKSCWISSQCLRATFPELIREYNEAIANGKIVESIVSHDKRPRYVIKYLIRWADKAKGETWETKEEVSRICPQLMKAYNKKLEEDEADWNSVDAILDHKIVHGVSKYLIRWSDRRKGKTWESAKKTIDLCPLILDEFTVKNPDCVPRIIEKRAVGIPEISRNQNAKQRRKPTVLIEDFDEDIDYEVERIVDMRIKRDVEKTKEFLVQWVGYRSDYNSWLSQGELNCPDLIEKFMAKKAKRDSSKVASKPEPVRKSLTSKRKVVRKPAARNAADQTKSKKSSRSKRLARKR